MRRLMLLRHAMAEPADGFADFDRPLTARGRSAAQAIASWIAQNGMTPDLALISPARRAIETWEIVAASLADSPLVRHDRMLYGASDKILLAAIGKAAERRQNILIVGHNPGLEQLANGLARSGNEPDLQRLRIGLPAGALAVIGFAASRWKQIAANGRLEALVTPADRMDDDE